MRFGTAADADALEAMYRQLDPNDRYRRFFTGSCPGRRFVEYWSSSPDATVVVTVDGDSIVGDAGFSLDEAGRADLGIAVDERHRGWLGPFLLDLVLRTRGRARRSRRRRRCPRHQSANAHAHRRTRMCDLAVRRPFGRPPPVGDRPLRPRMAWSLRPRVLLELGSGRSRLSAALADAGFDVVACPGPDANRSRRWHCPVLEGHPCPLVGDADVVIGCLRASAVERTDGSVVLDAVRRLHPGVPMTVVDPTTATAAEVVAHVHELRGRRTLSPTPQTMEVSIMTTTMHASTEHTRLTSCCSRAPPSSTSSASRRVSRPHAPALRYRDGDGDAWQTITWRAYERAVAEVAVGLRSVGTRARRPGRDPERQPARVAHRRPGDPRRGPRQHARVPTRARRARSPTSSATPRCACASSRTASSWRRSSCVAASSRCSSASSCSSRGRRRRRLRRTPRRACGPTGRQTLTRGRSRRPSTPLANAVTPTTSPPSSTRAARPVRPRGAMITHGNMMATLRSLTSLDRAPPHRPVPVVPAAEPHHRAVRQPLRPGGRGRRDVVRPQPGHRARRPPGLPADAVLRRPRVWEKFRDAIVEGDASAARPPGARLQPLPRPRRRGVGDGRDDLGTGTASGRSTRSLDRRSVALLRAKLGLDRARILVVGRGADPPRTCCGGSTASASRSPRATARPRSRCARA